MEIWYLRRFHWLVIRRNRVIFWELTLVGGITLVHNKFSQLEDTFKHNFLGGNRNYFFQIEEVEKYSRWGFQ